MSDQPDTLLLDDAHVAIFRERERLDAYRDPDDAVEYRWIQRDANGRIEAVLRNPIEGAEKIAWTPELEAAKEADFVKIRAAKFARLPREQRAEIVLADPVVRLALFDQNSPDPARRAAATVVLENARAKIDPPR